MSIIIEKGANPSLEGGVLKAVETSFGSSFNMNDDMTTVVERRPLRPGLLTSLLGGSVNNVYLNTTSYAYDEKDITSVLPSGKSFTEYGKRVEKDVARRRYFDVGSFGLTARVAPQDWANKREAGTNRLMQESDLAGEMTLKIQEAWDLFDEYAYAQLITQGTNVTMGGPFTEYDFYQEIVGTARPAPIFIDLLGTPTDPAEVTMRYHVQKMQEEAGRMRDQVGMVVAVCGTQFFNARYELEKFSGHPREIKFGLDLATMPINTSSFGGNPTFFYQWFDSYDGIRYINYGSSIIDGEVLIPADRAYLIPLGSRNLIRVAYAPAQTRTYANTVAQQMYTWQKVDERTGLVMATESNKLFSLINPRAIIELTLTNPEA